MLTKNKDTDRLILSNIESDKDLISFCLTNKYFLNLCDDSFYRNRLLSKYPLQKCITGKNKYIEFVTYVNLLKKEGFIFTKYNNNNPKGYYQILCKKEKIGCFKCIPNVNWQIYLAARKSYNDLIDYIEKNKSFIYNDITFFNMGMCGAATGGNLNIVKFFVNKGANDWNNGMRAAAFGGHLEIAKYFIQKGADNFLQCRDIARNKKKRIVKFFDFCLSVENEI